MNKNIYAHTEPGGSYPEYISINHNDQYITITVRNPRNEDSSEGTTATISLDTTQAKDLATAILQALSA